MSFNNQGAHHTSGISLGTTTVPNGFVYADLEGTWNETTEGNYFLLTCNDPGNAVVELMSDYLYSGIEPSAEANIPVTPVFDYVYSSDMLKIAKVIRVIAPNQIIVERTLGGLSNNVIGATTSIIKPPTRISFTSETLSDFLILAFPDGTGYTTPTSGASTLAEKSIWAGFGTLIPFLSASNAGAGATAAIVEY